MLLLAACHGSQVGRGARSHLLGGRTGGACHRPWGVFIVHFVTPLRCGKLGPNEVHCKPRS
eukprot:12835588-Prorocentrum_lima.AAC.1